MDEFDRELREAVDWVSVRRLQSAYADVVNRRAWPELADLFLPDAEVTVDTRDRAPHVLRGPVALGEFVGDAIARFDLFEFVVLNAHVELAPRGDADAATARVFMCELRHDRESGELSRAFGLYRDVYRRVAAGWRFAGRRYASLARGAAGAPLSVLGLPDDLEA